MTDYAEVLAVERTCYGQRVNAGVFAAQVTHLAVRLRHGELQLLSQLSGRRHGDDLAVLHRLVAHDIVLVFSPRLLVGVHGAVGHVNLHALVLREHVHAAVEVRRHWVQHMYGFQRRASAEGLVEDLVHLLGNLDGRQARASVEGVGMYLRQCRRQRYAAQVHAVAEPVVAYVVEAYAGEVAELVERVDIVVAPELAVEPREAYVCYARQVDVVVP